MLSCLSPLGVNLPRSLPGRSSTRITPFQRRWNGGSAGRHFRGMEWSGLRNERLMIAVKHGAQMCLSHGLPKTDMSEAPAVLSYSFGERIASSWTNIVTFQPRCELRRSCFQVMHYHFNSGRCSERHQYHPTEKVLSYLRLSLEHRLQLNCLKK